MNYQFATIRHIDEVREAIKGREEFIEATRDGFTVFNYMVNFPQTFPPVKQVYYDINSSGDAILVDGDHPVNEIEYEDETAVILRELRGITFCNVTGKVIARKLHKFFNVGEKEECRPETIDWSKPHRIEEKLDGSMITPVRLHTGAIQWHTKMGKTGVADQVLPFIEKNPNYRVFAEIMLGHQMTPIFEWCSPQQRIVIDHKEDRLVLLAMRDMLTGRYMPREGLERWTTAYGIDLVKSFANTAEDINKFIEETRGLTDTEGYVITFEDGHKVKLKCDWYVQLHKTKDRISHERYVVELIASGSLDDLKPVIMDTDREMVEKYEEEFAKTLQHTEEGILLFFESIGSDMPRKEFALLVNDRVNQKLRSIFFNLFPLLPAERKVKVKEELIRFLLKGVGSNRNFAEMKAAMFPHIQYRGTSISDE